MNPEEPGPEAEETEQPEEGPPEREGLDRFLLISARTLELLVEELNWPEHDEYSLVRLLIDSHADQDKFGFSALLELTRFRQK